MKAILLFGCMLMAVLACGQVKNGFDLSNASIPSEEIRQGGPPRDGIPAINQPQFTEAAKVTMPDSMRVLGVAFTGEAKAYPVNILNYHEIVNDHFGEHPIVITYCPLCASGIAFDARINGKSYTFGVSGLLYNSDVLLYDRQTESLWSQIMMEAVSGPMLGTTLTPVATQNTSWKNWKEQYPNSKVLSEATGYERDYSRNPYPGYGRGRTLYFDVSARDDRFHPKEMVIGITVDGKAKAYPFSELAAWEQAMIQDKFQQKELRIQYNEESKSARILDEKGQELPALTTFWFAWFAFHPETAVFSADD